MFGCRGCRFPYEFEGGHIRGAMNLCTPLELERALFRDGRPTVEGSGRTAIVLHCEYSSRRAPKLWKHLRNLDRTVNLPSYPQLHYPEIYVLGQGYKSFVQTHEQACVEGLHAGSKYIGM